MEWLHDFALSLNHMDPKEGARFVELCLKIVVTVFAGAWAIFLLIYLRKRALAQTDLAEKNAKISETMAKIHNIDFNQKHATEELELKTRREEMAIKETELRTRQQANLVVELEPTVLRSIDNSGFVIVTMVTLTNRGNHQTRINWNSPTFAVYSVIFDKDGRPEYVDQIKLDAISTKDPRELALPLNVRAGGIERVTFVFRVLTAGVYLLSFRGPVDPETSQQVQSLRPSAWTCNKYIVVSDEQITDKPLAGPSEPILVTQPE